MNGNRSMSPKKGNRSARATVAVEPMEPRRLLAGSGLSAIYFDKAAIAGGGEKDFTGTSVTRIESSINFNWGTGSPSPSIGSDTFTARFAGEVETPVGQTGTYTFRTYSNDGVRLWVDDKLIINNWTVHDPVNDDGTISLEGGKRYHIVLEYFENVGNAVINLQWKKPGDSGFTIIPTANLHPLQRDFPASSSAGYLNVRESFTYNGITYQAVGDGITNDTAAIQAAVNAASGRFVYVPNGTYRLTDSIILGSTQTDAKYKIIQGQNRDNTVFRLDDSASGFTNAGSPKSLFNFWNSTGQTGQAFRNSIFDLTINVGANNPGAKALRFVQNNQGGLWNITLRAEVGSNGQRQGVTGLDLTPAWPGPGAVRDLLIEGFNIGMDIGHYQLSMNFENVTFQEQNVKVIQNFQNVVTLLSAKSRNAVPFYTDSGSRGRLTVLNSRIENTGGSNVNAITQSGAVFLRNSVFSGFGKIVDNASGADLSDPAVPQVEYTNYGYGGAFADSPDRSLNLPIESIPSFDYDPPSNWVRIDPGTSSDDDTQRIRDAIAFANANGRKTVYFVGWNRYQISDTIEISGSVERIFGFDSTIAPLSGLYGSSNKPMFRFTGSGSPVVLERFYGDYPTNTFTWIEDASSRTVVLRNLLLRRTNVSSGQPYSDGIRTTTAKNGKLFIEDASVPTFEFRGSNTTVHARQLNPESQHKTNVVINAAKVSMIGFKIEGGFSGIDVQNNAKVEVLGAMPYPNVDPGTRPLYKVTDSQAFFLSRQNNPTYSYNPEVTETRGGITLNSTGETWAYVAFGSASINVTQATASGTYNLTSQGTSDWGKWGRSAVGDFDRKATGGSKISNWTAVGGASMSRSYSNNVYHSWTDGTPTTSATNSGYIRTSGTGKGFEFTVAATTAQQTLKVYVGTQYSATGKLELIMDDGSITPYTTTVTGGSGVSDYVFTINFSAASNTLLRVRWTANNSTGNVLLRAASLA